MIHLLPEYFLGVLAGVSDPRLVDEAFARVWSGFPRELVNAVHVAVLSEAFIVVATRVYFGSKRVDDRKGFCKPVRHVN